MVKGSFADTGDIVWLNFNPQAGKEQAGRRPAVVITPRYYNEKSGLMLCCPITPKAKGYPFEVRLPERMKTKGVVLVDHVRSVDIEARLQGSIERLPEDAMGEVCELLMALLSPDWH